VEAAASVTAGVAFSPLKDMLGFARDVTSNSSLETTTIHKLITLHAGIQRASRSNPLMKRTFAMTSHRAGP
jgi:hypothetical protein